MGLDDRPGVFAVSADDDDGKPFQKLLNAVPPGDDLHLIPARQEVELCSGIPRLHRFHGLVCIGFFGAVKFHILHRQPGILRGHRPQHLQPQLLRNHVLGLPQFFHLVLHILVGGGNEQTAVRPQSLHGCQQYLLVRQSRRVEGAAITTIFSTGCAACSVCRLSIILPPPFPTEMPLRRAALYIRFAVLLPCFFAFMDCFSFYSHPKALSIFFCPSPLQQPHRSGSFSGFRYKTLWSTTGSVDSTAYPLH